MINSDSDLIYLNDTAWEHGTIDSMSNIHRFRVPIKTGSSKNSSKAYPACRKRQTLLMYGMVSLFLQVSHYLSSQWEIKGNGLVGAVPLQIHWPPEADRIWVPATTVPLQSWYLKIFLIQKRRRNKMAHLNNNRSWYHKKRTKYFWWVWVWYMLMTILQKWQINNFKKL